MARIMEASHGLMASTRASATAYGGHLVDGRGRAVIVHRHLVEDGRVRAPGTN